MTSTREQTGTPDQVRRLLAILRVPTKARQLLDCLFEPSRELAIGFRHPFPPVIRNSVVRVVSGRTSFTGIRVEVR